MSIRQCRACTFIITQENGHMQFTNTLPEGIRGRKAPPPKVTNVKQSKHYKPNQFFKTSNIVCSKNQMMDEKIANILRKPAFMKNFPNFPNFNFLWSCPRNSEEFYYLLQKIIKKFNFDPEGTS